MVFYVLLWNWRNKSEKGILNMIRKRVYGNHILKMETLK